MVIEARQLLTALAGLVVMLSVTGCSGGDGAGASQSSTARPAAPASSKAPTLRNAISALDDLSVTACPSGSGELEATGELRNYSTRTADYVVTVDWLDASGGVVGSDFAVVPHVLTRQQKSWTVSTTLDRPAASCTTRVSRGRL